MNRVVFLSSDFYLSSRTDRIHLRLYCPDNVVTSGCLSGLYLRDCRSLCRLFVSSYEDKKQLTKVSRSPPSIRKRLSILKSSLTLFQPFHTLLLILVRIFIFYPLFHDPWVRLNLWHFTIPTFTLIFMKKW